MYKLLVIMFFFTHEVLTRIAETTSYNLDC